MNNLGSLSLNISRVASRKAWRLNQGFNLVEVVVVIAIVGMISMMALPAYTGLMAGMKAKTTATDLYMALVKTRSEAIKRNANVTLSVGSGGWKIYPTAAEGNVLEDHTINGDVTLSGADVVEYNGSGRIAGVVSFGIKAVMGDKSSESCVSTSLSGLPKVKNSPC